MKQRVVITGMGAITPIGNDVESFWEGLKAGKVGIDAITKFDTTEFKAKLAAEVKDFNAADYMDRKEARRMDLFSQYAVAAAQEAIKSANIDFEKIDPFRFGVMVGSGIGGLGTIENEAYKLKEKGPNRVSPMLIPLIITNMAAGNIAINFGLKGKCSNVVTACATATHSIGEAYRAIQYGEADAMVAGGTEGSITPLGIAGFNALTALSTSTDPLKASRPFDKNRDGFVMGEGAGILVLESLDHALNRGANILAEIVGYGATCDAYHITSPSETGEGAARAMLIAINEAGIKPEEVSYINAHGTSTYYNDLFETKSIKEVFKESAYNIPISSTKSMVGHLLGAAGGVEGIACVKSILEDFVHPTAGYETKDEDCDLDYIPNEGRKCTVNYAISNSLGFGGHNGSLLFAKYKG
ncbi:3-oxoacyl-[acyl-carrier-protein] synthase II [Natranaerovirga pectinivora]|uniref:3-oxoacyl-[acyl-carrier-protein] synthase 2 n=1 Tax=Natranaerovirga pectinivora TaxID=682400 RepID=A0A4R3MII8_9FIRM|nr:beta-ketoacyl-ACP synthase II [Natranaerovirga pectinivora]TCT12294.1 3-oxoacyl-[acyl-carrier-protein] synthase II [Natranaerovirga pectinivora]